MSTISQWYALYTRPKAQKKVCDILTKKKLECFYPALNVARHFSSNDTTFSQPLFRSYVFVKSTPEDHGVIRQVEGVVSFVHWLGEPATFRETEVNKLREVLSSYYNIRLEKIQVNFTEEMTVVEEDKSKDRLIREQYKPAVKVYLPSMGYVVTAETRMPEGRLVTLATDQAKSKKAII